MKIEPLTGVIGARITGIDLQNVDEPAAKELRENICRHQVVVIPDQSLSPKEQTEFSHQLGPYSPVPFVQPIPNHPEVIKIVKKASEVNAFNFGGVWHSDFSFLETPPAFTILHSIDVPVTGGDTVWTSNSAAYEALDSESKSKFESVTCIHSASASYSPKQQNLHSALTGMDIRTSTEAEKTQEHPLVCTHPETGIKSLFFNGTYVRGLRGPEISSSEDEEHLLLWLHNWTTHVRFTFRHRWANGDVVIWDNRSTQHVAINDYAGQRRELNRTTVAGEIPSLY
ncbi:MAG: (R)-phenoxypropionate/alpha-ketoglutarate-dioxygenase [Acidimicrobiales bacterium AG-410-I20]|nr:MAG: (R)-phenoxypropionate/alpha-ketoglutarate-dioxygenase [Acidimicrobiales bacterium AG-410-I20]